MEGKADGFTLVEVVVAVTILVLVLSAALLLYAQGALVYKREEVQVDIQENARIALDRLVRELRSAKEIVTIQSNSITFILDDGSRVRYYHDVGRQQLMREKGGGVNPVASFIKDLRFEKEAEDDPSHALIGITLVAGEREKEGFTLSTKVLVR
ncbi:MAG: prepilin-type N-terminal cleavage/methylation domain-containing protein [Thermanaeromonas sp.]|uniref:prepilin-type N-terminal cleavage/methylation domain-containing protein n=1 Tax=Thermanaeromonas sp. TaxID=2003697 RepID=UPI00243B5172|nr:prepilin-type N-terminal cleavage/methylation domain-containing protein [Thermanaeromonas sp.]MCG0277594.1 prepilin-type N-terminal cleavage/methylation domain-containing protein [Thermanaeromonas sp.]